MKTWDFLSEMSVCATMSAGKSTLLNALFGFHYIPSSNLACTAKITSILNCDIGKNSLFGAKRISNEQLVEEVVTHETISLWNSDDNVKQIYLVGAFQNIPTPFVVHDTPGINSSINLNHKNISQKFLSENPPHLLAFVINAENNGSNDETEFLCWLKRNLIDKHNTEIIFILNKMDSPDFERENLQAFLEDTYNGLINLSFESPRIFPVSAHAALLFRMLLNKQKLTWNESISLISYYNYFCDDGLNLSEKNSNAIESVSDEVVNFLGKNYSVASLHEAIRRTGICDLEDFLMKKFKEIDGQPSTLKFIPVGNSIKAPPNSPKRKKLLAELLGNMKLPLANFVAVIEAFRKKKAVMLNSPKHKKLFAELLGTMKLPSTNFIAVIEALRKKKFYQIKN